MSRDDHATKNLTNMTNTGATNLTASPTESRYKDVLVRRRKSSQSPLARRRRSSSSSHAKTTDEKRRLERRFSALVKDSRMQFLQKREVIYREDIADWFSRLFGVALTEDSLVHGISDGTLLCRLGSLVHEHLGEWRLRPLQPADTIIAPKYNKLAKPGTFQARDNIANFIEFARVMGTPPACLFETNDLVLSRNENQIWNCLMEIARGAPFLGALPRLVEFEHQIDGFDGEDDDPESFPSDGHIEAVIDTVVHAEMEEEADTLSMNGYSVGAEANDIKEENEEEEARKRIQSRKEMLKPLGKGKYLFGTQVLHCRVFKNHVVVRVGGGWDSFENYLSTHAQTKDSLSKILSTPEASSHDLSDALRKKSRAVVDPDSTLGSLNLSFTKSPSKSAQVQNTPPSHGTATKSPSAPMLTSTSKDGSNRSLHLDEQGSPRLDRADMLQRHASATTSTPSPPKKRQSLPLNLASPRRSSRSASRGRDPAGRKSPLKQERQARARPSVGSDRSRGSPANSPSPTPRLTHQTRRASHHDKPAGKGEVPSQRKVMQQRSSPRHQHTTTGTSAQDRRKRDSSSPQSQKLPTTQKTRRRSEDRKAQGTHRSPKSQRARRALSSPPSSRRVSREHTNGHHHGDIRGQHAPQSHQQQRQRRNTNSTESGPWWERLSHPKHAPVGAKETADCRKASLSPSSLPSDSGKSCGSRTSPLLIPESSQVQQPLPEVLNKSMPNMSSDPLSEGLGRAPSLVPKAQRKPSFIPSLDVSGVLSCSQDSSFADGSSTTPHPSHRSMSGSRIPQPDGCLNPTPPRRHSFQHPLLQSSPKRMSYAPALDSIGDSVSSERLPSQEPPTSTYDSPINLDAARWQGADENSTLGKHVALKGCDGQENDIQRNDAVSNGMATATLHPSTIGALGVQQDGNLGMAKGSGSTTERAEIPLQSEGSVPPPKMETAVMTPSSPLAAARRRRSLKRSLRRRMSPAHASPSSKGAAKAASLSPARSRSLRRSPRTSEGVVDPLRGNSATSATHSEPSSYQASGDGRRSFVALRGASEKPPTWV